jgi:hypothetical protein
MTVTEATFQERAEDIVRDFIRSVLLIDDDWPEVADSALAEARPAPASAFGNPSARLSDPPFFSSGTAASDAAIIGGESPGDARRLLKIQKSVIDSGVLFSGIKYPGTGPEQIRKLAARADVLILDWHLRAGSDDSSDALSVLHQLNIDGGLHFVCIYTGHGDAAAVKADIVTKLGVPAEGGKIDFRVANLVVAIRQKPSVSIGAVVTEEEIYNTAVKSIAQTYHGYVQLGLLELTNRHREQLPKMLVHLGPDIDAAVVYEATDDDSPVRDASGPFLSMVLDEWRALLSSSMRKTPMKIMSDDGVRAYLRANLDKIDASLGKRVEASMTCVLNKTVDQQLQGWINSSMVNDVNAWILAGAEGLPASIPSGWNGKKRKKKEDEKVPRWALLAAVLTEGAPTQRNAIYQPLLKVDSLFQMQINLPSQLTQGTVLRAQAGEYLVCVTPLCDAAHPKNKIDFVYSFLVGEVVDIGTTTVDGYGFPVIRGTEYVALNVSVKRHVRLRVAQPALISGSAIVGSVWFPTWQSGNAGETVDAEADLPSHDVSSIPTHFSPAPEVRLMPVGQLRVEFALSLAQMAAAEATRVGVDRSEFLRTRFSK